MPLYLQGMTTAEEVLSVAFTENITA